MARKLSRIAENGIIIWASFVAAALAPRAWGEPGVAVSPATSTVENPFTARLRAPQSTAVPREANDQPRMYQNPFAARSAPPRVLTPTPNSGSLSRWRRPVELPGSGSANRITSPTDERWDVLSPDTLGEQNAPPSATQAIAPPDPVRFAPSALHQPYWLLPDPTTGQDATAEPVAAVRLPKTVTPSAAPIANDPFEQAGDSMVLVSDTPHPKSHPAPGSQDPAGCYAQAEQAAATATTVEEFGSVIRLCQAGLASRPQGELSSSLRKLAAWAANRRGEIKSDDRREDEAMREFEIAIQFDPNCWLALHNRAVSRAQQGQADGAIQDFNRAIELNPGLAIAYRNRGELLAAMGRSEEAVADYGRALSQLPDDANLLLMRGHTLHRLGRFQESLADLNRSIKLAPQNAEAYAHRGNVFAEMGQFSRATKDFQQALQLDPESPDAYRSLAWLMATCPDARFRDRENALAAAQRAANLAPPGDCFVLDALAAAHANAGQFDQAVRYQKEAVSIAPDGFQQSFSGRLALYQRRQPYRNGSERATDGRVRAASLETRGR